MAIGQSGEADGLLPGGQLAYERITQNGEQGIQDRHHRQEAYRCPALSAITTPRIEFLVGTADRRVDSKVPKPSTRRITGNSASGALPGRVDSKASRVDPGTAAFPQGGDTAMRAECGQRTEDEGLCRDLCHNPPIPAGVGPCRREAFGNSCEAADMRQPCMNTASQCRSHFVSVAPSEFELRNGMEGVVGAIPTRSTNHYHSGINYFLPPERALGPGQKPRGARNKISLAA